MNVARRLQYVVFALLLSLLVILAPRNVHTAFAEEEHDYAEGQAIVGILDRDDLSVQSDLPYSFEELMEVSASAAGIDSESLGVLVTQGEPRVRIELVTSSSLSTEELIRELEADPHVVFAEPNGLIVLPEPSSQVDDLEPQLNPSASPATISDLTGIQWGMWSGASYSIIGSEQNPSVNSPGFGPDGRRGDNMASEVIVAILDQGIDYQNPDLTDVVYRFSESEQLLLGCGEWGFNAMGDSTDGVPIPLDKDANHGTHCAGILGASWDGHGISGVASNVRIVSIQIAKPGRANSLADVLRAFEFVKRANDAGIGIQITSNSWGQHRSSLALDAAVRNLGEACGTVCVFSGGNENGVDSSLSERTSSLFADNPYTIVVAATNPEDEIAKFSNLGETTVDIAAPGSYILSTVPLSSATYLPDATRDDDTFYEGFDSEEPSAIATLTYYPTPDTSSVDGEGDPDLFGSGEMVLGKQAETSNSNDSEGLTDQADAGSEAEAPDEGNDGAALSAEGGQEGVTVQGERVSDCRLNGSAGLRFSIDRPKKSGSYPIHIDIDLGLERMSQLAEQDELYFGFSYMVDGSPMMSYPTITTNVTEDSPLSNMGGSTLSFDTAWLSMSYDLTANGHITPSEDGHLIVDINLSISGDVSAIYLDSLGIGTKLSPYAFMSGTSMATPLVAGGAAVVASQTGATGAELAAQVRAHVRVPDAGALPVRTGGVLDLSVATSNITGPKVLSAATRDGSVSISGVGFGDEPGTVSFSRYVAGRDLEPMNATVSSWSDTGVACALDKPFSGILHVQVTNASGLTDSALVFVGKGEQVYEQDLPFAAGTGEPFVSEAPGDYETKGPLVGLGCKLYYLPCHQYIEGVPAHNKMLVFDLKTETWSEGPALPEWLSSVSACIFDGKLVVEGSKMFLNELGIWTTVTPEGEQGEERVYVFDPAAQAWTRASSEGMHLDQTIFNDGGTLKLFGGYHTEVVHYVDDDGETFDYTDDFAYPLVSYDLESGVTDELLDDIPFICVNPSVAACNGVIVAYNPRNGLTLRIRDGKVESLIRDNPNFLMGNDDEIHGEAHNYTYDPYVLRASLSPVEGGFILVGPPAKDGSSDTYFLADGADEYVAFPKRASEARVTSLTSTAYRGRLFVIGSSFVEPEKRLFRATAIDTIEYPGDVPCEKDEPDEPVDPTPTTPDTKPDAQPSKSASALPKTSDITASIVMPLVEGVIVLVLSQLIGMGDDKS